MPPDFVPRLRHPIVAVEVGFGSVPVDHTASPVIAAGRRGSKLRHYRMPTIGAGVVGAECSYAEIYVNKIDIIYSIAPFGTLIFGAYPVFLT